MNDSKVEDLAFKAEVQRKTVANCISNLHLYFRSKNWEILAHKFRSLGYVLPNDLISCKLCDEDTEGYYFYKQKKIIMCANNVLDQNFSSVITHQMINSFDDARAEIEPSNPAHIACTSIRGVNLSKQCTPDSILSIWTNPNKYKNCVREKSTSVLLRHKDLNLDPEKAEDIISDVWDTCFYDYEPYTMEEHKKSNS